MSLLILGRAGETRIITNLGAELSIRVVSVNADRVLLDISSAPSAQSAENNLPIMLRKQAD